MTQIYPKILSFDVGVVNLSYCLLTQKMDCNNQLHWAIIEWNNIDLTNTDIKLCTFKNSHNTENGNPTNSLSCSLKASYMNTINNIDCYYCKKHSKNINLSNEPYDYYFQEYKGTEKCCYKFSQTSCALKDNETPNEIRDYTFFNKEKSRNSIEVGSCTKLGKYLFQNHNTSIQSNKYYCTVHAKQYYNNIKKTSELKKIKTKKSTNYNFDELKYNLIMELEKRPNLLLANYVVIENQPSFKNPRMKSIALTLHDYYLIRGIIDKKLTNSSILYVKFLSPSNKLKLISETDEKKLKEKKSDNNSSQTYKLTKKLGIDYCLKNIQHLHEWLTYFESHKKKDDLADCFLQGIYFYNTIRN